MAKQTDYLKKARLPKVRALKIGKPKPPKNLVGSLKTKLSMPKPVGGGVSRKRKPF